MGGGLCVHGWVRPPCHRVPVPLSWMDYQALYRKHRPQRFDEVIGQDHVTMTLTREIIEGKIAHAYLFAGPRGTGKTTSARLLAKALNCESPAADGEPDNVCESCIAIAAGHSLDVIELDAASHNKVEDIREIRMNVSTVAAAGGARRVYILDEAHMLSRAAGNALLKTLEEPPAHVVFVLATTEPYKMLDTVRSRSQRFDFHRVPAEILIDYLADIARREDFTFQQEALSMIASHSDGSVRDALSLLEQVAALGSGSVEADAVARALGLADREAFGTLAAAISEQDAPAALTLIAALASRGADLRRFVSEALGFFRGVFLAQYAPNLDEIVDEPLETLDEWRRQAGALAPADVLRSIDQLAEALSDLRQGREERLVVELTVLRLTRPETVVDPAALDARVARLETSVKMLAARGATPKAAPTPRQSSPASGGDEQGQGSGEPFASEHHAAAAATVDDGTVIGSAPTQPALDETSETPPPPRSAASLLTDLDTFEGVWPALVARIRDEAGPRRHAWLKEASPTEVDAGLVTLEVPRHLPFHLEQLRADQDLKAMVRDIAGSLLGGSIDVVFREAAASEPPAGAERGRAPNKEDLAEPDEADDDDPAALVVEALGGEIVSE